jgi:hypothetical protein
VPGGMGENKTGRLENFLISSTFGVKCNWQKTIILYVVEI